MRAQRRRLGETIVDNMAARKVELAALSGGCTALTKSSDESRMRSRFFSSRHVASARKVADWAEPPAPLGTPGPWSSPHYHTVAPPRTHHEGRRPLQNEVNPEDCLHPHEHAANTSIAASLEHGGQRWCRFVFQGKPDISRRPNMFRFRVIFLETAFCQFGIVSSLYWPSSSFCV